MMDDKPLTAIFLRWHRHGLPALPVLAARLCRDAGIDDGSPVHDACIAIAAASEAWGGYPYHGRAHHAEVATTAAFLASGLPPEDVGQLLCAAFGHDIFFEPAAPRRPFAAERLAADEVCRIALGHGVAADFADGLRLLVLATEPMARHALRDALEGAAGALPPVLAALGDDRRLLALAAVLSDADVLGSSGLGREWAGICDERYARECGQPTTAAVTRQFLSAVVGPDFLSPVGKGFEVRRP